MCPHVEDDHSFERFMTTISKVPSIDTESSREVLSSQLLKEPTDYIDTCEEAFRESNVDLTVEKIK